MPFGTEKLEWRGYQIVKIFDDTFIRFDTTHECDRQTPHDDIGHALAQHRAAKKIRGITKLRICTNIYIFTRKLQSRLVIITM